MKKLLSLFLAALLVFALAACGTSPAGPDEPEVTDAPEAPVTPDEPVTPEVPEAPSGQEYECDVVVAGSGPAGMLAALSAADAGASVILVEKLSFGGGTGNVAGGYIVTVGNSNFPEECNIENAMATVKAIHDQAETKTYPFYDHLEYVLGESGNTIDYMLGLGLKAEFLNFGLGMTHFEGNGAGMMTGLIDAATQKGVQIMYDCPAEEILMEDGAAVGIRAKNAEGDVIIRAKKTIITTGGAAFDQERLLTSMPTLANMTIAQQAVVSDTGDGYRMMEAIGAQFYDGYRIMEGGATFDRAFTSLVAAPPATTNKIMITAEGKRFTNEAPSSGQILGYYMIKDGSSAHYWLYDSSDEEAKAALDAGLASGEVFYGDTIEDLATAMGADPATLRATFDRYQELCADGVDADFGKSAEALVPYATDGGYYAARTYAIGWGTLGGVATDMDARVLDANGSVIPNLFAAGEMTNRKFFSDFYIGGCSLATSTTFGRLAGENAVAEMN